MNEKQKIEREAGALARFAAISWMETAQKGGLSLAAAVQSASQQSWNGRSFAASTLERFFYRYRAGGFGALHHKSRSDAGQIKALSASVQERLSQLRGAYPQINITSLVAQLREEKLLQEGTYSLASIYRYLQRVGLDRRTLKAAGPGGISGPTKAFEVAWSNGLWMTDCMHGPTLRDAQSGKAVSTRLFAILDDCSRLCVAAQYYGKETVECFLDVLRQALSRRGVPEKLYTDQGKVFTCHHVQLVCANLGIKLLHAKPYAAWSKGKIEKFFRRLQESFQAQLLIRPVGSLDQLNERLGRWLELEYNQVHHEALGTSPAARFTQKSAAVRSAPPGEELEGLFLYRTTRRVRRDATISLDGQWWEVSPSLRGQQIELRYNPFGQKQGIAVWRQDRYVQMARRLDKQLNSQHFNRSNYERPDEF